jgi:hypothetical protein
LSAKHTVMKELVPRQISVNLALIQIWVKRPLKMCWTLSPELNSLQHFLLMMKVTLSKVHLNVFYVFFFNYFHAISLANICLDAANAIESNLTNLEEENCRVIFP